MYNLGYIFLSKRRADQNKGQEYAVELQYGNSPHQSKRPLMFELYSNGIIFMLPINMDTPVLYAISLGLDLRVYELSERHPTQETGIS